jgi:putative transposase
MPRFARLVVPGTPHHVTQRGNRRQPVFFGDQDRRLYLRILRAQGEKCGLQFWAYCLMDNHVHFIVVPQSETSLALGLGEAHRRYTAIINKREGWTGFLWQGRFTSYPLDEMYLYAAVRYVERNPVRAGMVKGASLYPWSSARAHVDGHEDPVLSSNFLVDEIQDWEDYLSEEETEKTIEQFEDHCRVGRPLGSPEFVNKLEKTTGRILVKQRAGRKPRGAAGLLLLEKLEK